MSTAPRTASSPPTHDTLTALEIYQTGRVAEGWIAMVLTVGGTIGLLVGAGSGQVGLALAGAAITAAALVLTGVSTAVRLRLGARLHALALARAEAEEELPRLTRRLEQERLRLAAEREIQALTDASFHA